MIRQLQRKFVSITAAALFSIILLVTAAINGLFFYQTDRMLETRLTQIMTWRGGSVPRPAPQEQPSGRRGEHGDALSSLPPPEDDGTWPLLERRLDLRPDGCLICLNADGSVREIRQEGSGLYTAEELSGIIADILSENKGSGWYQYYKFHRADNGSGETVIALLNASDSLYSVFTVALISGVIGLVCFLLVLLIVILASRRAVGPIAESYIRQKQFVTDAGHELKTPLTVISANNELLRILYGDNEWSDGIDRQVTKMSGLVQNLIALAKMDEEQKPVFSSFNLSDAVYDTVMSLENLIRSRERSLSLDIEEGVFCTGDESRLRQLVSILMDNAAKYCDEKGVISVSLKADRMIRLQVVNDYDAVDSCDLEQVFLRFYRADKARTPDGSYGLGLSIARSIVELHRGTIHAKALGHDKILFEVLLHNYFTIPLPSSASRHTL